MKLSEAMAAAKAELAEQTGSILVDYGVLADLVDAVEETLMAQKREADILLDLADLRRWGGCE